MGQRGSRTINDCSTSWLLARWRHPDSAFEVPARRVRSEPLDQFQQSCHLFFKHSVKPHHLSLTNIFTNILWFQKHVQLYIYIYRLGILCIKWCSFLDLIFVYISLYMYIYCICIWSQVCDISWSHEGSGRSSHFMNSEVVIDFLDNVLAPSFDYRRRVLAERYGRSFEDEYGIILCDSFTGHHSTSGGWDVQRNLDII